MDRHRSGISQGRTFGAQFRLVLFFVLTWLGVAVLLALLLSDARSAAGRKAESDARAAAGLLEARRYAACRGSSNIWSSRCPGKPTGRRRAGVFVSTSLANWACMRAAFPKLPGCEFLMPPAIPSTQAVFPRHRQRRLIADVSRCFRRGMAGRCIFPRFISIACPVVR